MKRSFQSRWSRELQKFIEFRQTYFTSEWPESALRRFDSWAVAHPGMALQEAIALWLKRTPQALPVTRSNELIAIRQFCLYRRRFDPQAYVPDNIVPRIRSRFRAYILSPNQIKVLVKTIDELPGPPLRLARLRALFLVLYCTGLRLGEALRLRLVDVDLKRAYFRIGPSKGRTRLVPFGTDLATELKIWLDKRRRAGFVLAPQTPLFERENGRPDNLGNAGTRFNMLFRRCGFKPPPGSGRVGLRVHDLRHNYALHRLQNWYRAGLDPGPLLPWLSAYMGHGNLLGTQHYLTATPQRLSAASRRFQRSVGFDPVTR
jgi:integrase/recombinase XerD